MTPTQLRQLASTLADEAKACLDAAGTHRPVSVRDFPTIATYERHMLAARIFTGLGAALAKVAIQSEHQPEAPEEPKISWP